MECFMVAQQQIIVTVTASLEPLCYHGTTPHHQHQQAYFPATDCNPHMQLM